MTPIRYDSDLDIITRTLFRQVTDCKLSNRLTKCLKNAGLIYIGDVIQRNDEQLLAIRNFGRKCLNELKEFLSELDLRLSAVPDWKILPPEQVIQRLRQHSNPAEVSVSPLSKIDAQTCIKLFLSVEELDLSVRGARCLKALKIRYIGDLVQRSRAELLKTSNFGRRTLAEIEKKLAELDLRLGTRLSKWTPEIIKETENLFAKELKQLRDTRAEEFLQSLCGSPDTLEDELSSLTKLGGTERNSRIIIRYFGWNGDAPTSLEAAGAEFGITRERVRQIISQFEKKVRWRTNRKILATPILDKALQFVVESAPCRVEEIESGLSRKGIAGKPFRLEGLIRTAEFFQLRFPFNILKVRKNRFVVLSEDRRGAAAILRCSRRIAGKQGVATVSDVVAQAEEEIGRRIAPDFGIAILSSLPDFAWLDEANGWFWRSAVPAGRNRLINCIEKILSTGNSIHISELRAGIARPVRMEGFAPPRRVLLELCRQLPSCRVEGDTIIADPPLDWQKVLAAANEWAICAVLKEHGPVLARTELERMCLELGMNEHSFWMCLTHSPIIVRHATGVYGLRGVKIPPGLVESLRMERRTGKRVMDYGWTGDGRVWVGISLSEAILRRGVFTTPAAMKRFIQGDFVLKSADGFTVGNLRIRDSRGWGLRRLFDRRGGEPGDCLVLAFNPSSKEAVAYLGEQDLLDNFRPES